MNIKLIKFTTGEECMFDVVREDDNSIVVKNGLTMIFDGQNIRAVPFSVNTTDDQEIVLGRTHMVFITVPRDDLKQMYQQQFSSVILPQSNGLKI